MAQSFLQITKRLTVGVIYSAGILSVGCLLFLLILAELPPSHFKTEVFEKLKTITRKIEHYLENKNGGTPDSPIVVRGGSMTLRTKDTWYPNPPSDMKAPTCTNADTSYIDLIDVKPVSASPSGPIPLTLSDIPAPWQLVLYGRSPKDGSQSKNGIILQSQSGACTGSGSTSTTSVSATLLNSNNTSFYPAGDNANIDNDHGATHSVRFWDQTPDTGTTAATVGCQGPYPPSVQSKVQGDQDVCERISVIQLTLTPPPPAQPTVYTYKCPSGECKVDIGSQ